MISGVHLDKLSFPSLETIGLHSQVLSYHDARSKSYKSLST